MFNIEIAGLVLTIDNKYSLVQEKCRDYLTDKTNNTGIELSVTQERMNASIEYKKNFDGEEIENDAAEYDAIHYELYPQLPDFDAFWLHSVLIEKDGQGYAFSAQPGIGKTTHAKLWLKAFPDARIVNGDNTIIRKDTDGTMYGYGTPFCGKEGYQINKKVPLKAVCFINRSETNYVQEMNPMDAITRMFNENYTRRLKNASKLMNLYMDLAEQVTFYNIYCNMDDSAPLTVYEGIRS